MVVDYLFDGSEGFMNLLYIIQQRLIFQIMGDICDRASFIRRVDIKQRFGRISKLPKAKIIIYKYNSYFRGFHQVLEIAVGTIELLDFVFQLPVYSFELFIRSFILFHHYLQLLFGIFQLFPITVVGNIPMRQSLFILYQLIGYLGYRQGKMDVSSCRSTPWHSRVLGLLRFLENGQSTGFLYGPQSGSTAMARARQNHTGRLLTFCLGQRPEEQINGSQPVL